MSDRTWNVLCVVMAALSVVACLIALVWNGCTAQLQLASGASVPMKCHWTMRAAGLLEVGAVIAALGGFTTPGVHGRRVVSVMVAVENALVLLALLTPLMGLCAGDAAMTCRQHGVVVAVCAACAIVVAIVGLVRCNPAPRKPKKEL